MRFVFISIVLYALILVHVGSTVERERETYTLFERCTRSPCVLSYHLVPPTSGIQLKRHNDIVAGASASSVIVAPRRDRFFFHQFINVEKIVMKINKNYEKKKNGFSSHLTKFPRKARVTRSKNGMDNSRQLHDFSKLYRWNSSEWNWEDFIMRHSCIERQ